jgi:predicted nucleic acid-binding protein
VNLFLDACALIYRVEEVSGLAGRVADLLTAYRRKHKDAQLAVSRLSWLECRVHPLREGDAELLARYELFFSAADLRIIEMDANVVDGATRIRAKFGLRTPDAIQAASCLSLGYEHVFVTSDRVFARVPGLNSTVL